MAAIGDAAARRAAGQRKIKTTCTCGRVVNGNGRSHQRSCEEHLAAAGWPLDAAMADAVRDVYRPGTYPGVVTKVQQRLGQLYLARRAAGDKTELRWAEYGDLVWRYAAEAADGGAQ